MGDIKEYVGSSLKVVEKGSATLRELEGKIAGLFKAELVNIFKIGEILNEIRDKRLYRFKDSDGSSTWKDWTSEFMGSQDTANRYIRAFLVFKEFGNIIEGLPVSYIEKVSRAIEKLPEDKHQEVIEIAKNSPTLRELDKAIVQLPYSIDQLTIEGGHEHQWKEYRFKKCLICDKREEL